ncbi:MAG: hypothetical protein H7067_10575 [Burkholderiales bacterium]|nr:hypothetical protein [Opitutaceae bacterium]
MKTPYSQNSAYPSLRFLAGAFVALAGSSTVAHAAKLLADPFSFPDGPLRNAPGWYAGVPSYGASTESERHLLVRDDALLWDGLPSPINAILCRRLVPEGQALPPVVCIGFVLKVEGTPSRGGRPTSGYASGTFLALTDRTGKTQRGLLGIVHSEAEGCYRLSLGHSQDIRDTDVVPYDLWAGQEVRVVIVYDTVQQVGSLWINPAGTEDTSIHSTTRGGTMPLTSLGIRMRNFGKEDLGALRMSRLVVATTFAEAMPPR